LLGRTPWNKGNCEDRGAVYLTCVWTDRAVRFNEAIEVGPGGPTNVEWIKSIGQTVDRILMPGDRWAICFDV